MNKVTKLNVHISSMNNSAVIVSYFSKFVVISESGFIWKCWNVCNMIVFILDIVVDIRFGINWCF